MFREGGFEIRVNDNLNTTAPVDMFMIICRSRRVQQFVHWFPKPESRRIGWAKCPRIDILGWCRSENNSESLCCYRKEGVNLRVFEQHEIWMLSCPWDSVKEHIDLTTFYKNTRFSGTHWKCYKSKNSILESLVESRTLCTIENPYIYVAIFLVGVVAYNHTTTANSKWTDMQNRCSAMSRI